MAAMAVLEVFRSVVCVSNDDKKDDETKQGEGSSGGYHAHSPDYEVNPIYSFDHK